MLLAARLLIPALWLIWVLIWLVMARRAKPVAWRESRASRLVTTLPLVVAWGLFGAFRLPDWLARRWHEPSWALYWLGVALVAA